MSSLYNRKAYVIFGPRRSLNYVGGLFIFNNTFSGSGDNSLSVDNLGWPFAKMATLPPSDSNRGFKDLRVSFDITKTLESTANEADIEIYNVNEDSYKLLQKVKETNVVQLSIGYGMEANDILFLGDIENSYRYREGADWVLKIKAKDGQEISQDTIVNKSYRGGTTLKSILLDMIDSSKIVPEFAANKARKWIEENVSDDKKTENGDSLSGKWMVEMNKILSEIDASMSIQNETAQIIWNNSNSKNDIVIISPSSGLIGSPREKGGDEGIEFTSLLIPMIKPGGLVRIKSKSINDYFRVDKCTYKGDTHGNDWLCNCQATRPDNIAKDLIEIEYYKSKAIEEQLGVTQAVWKNLIT